MTSIWFVRHAQSDTRVHDDLSRPLTAQGLADRERVCAFFRHMRIDAVYSSPYRRAMDTVAPLAREKGLDMALVDALRERAVGTWVEDFSAYARRQWADGAYALPGGESLDAVRERVCGALDAIVRTHAQGTVAIGGHGTAICAAISHFDPTFGWADFCKIQNVMPWIVRLDFEGAAFAGYEAFDIMAGGQG